MILVDEYKTHIAYVGLSAKDEAYIAETVYRHTGVPLAKNPSPYGIDLISLDPDRPFVIEVEGAEPPTWGREDPYPKHWKDCSFVTKKLKHFLFWEARGVPSLYVRVNHYISQFYFIEGRLLIERLSEPDGVVLRNNRNSTMNDNCFITFTWDDQRLNFGEMAIRPMIWNLLKSRGFRKIKDRNRSHYLSPKEALHHLSSLKQERIVISLHDSAPMGLIQNYWWGETNMISLVRS